MSRIRLYAHPLAPLAPEVFEADSLAAWLLGRYGDAPAVKLQIFAGEPSAETDITDNIRAIVDGGADEYVILQSPGGVEMIWAIVIAVVVAVATVLLVPKPVLPGNVNRTQQSPNNALGSRENQVRIQQRVEDIFGTVKSIPSLMMPTYTKYANSIEYEYGYYCVGRGYYSLSAIQDGDTLISAITGASAAVYAPFTSPNSGDAPTLQIGDAIIDDVLTVKRAIEVNGITLKALNQVQLSNPADYAFSASAHTIVQSSGSPALGSLIPARPASVPNVNAVAAVGDTVTVSMSPYVLMDVLPPSSVTVNTDNNSLNDSSDTGGAFSTLFVGDVIHVSGFEFEGGSNDGTFTVISKPVATVLIVSGGILASGSSPSVVISKASGTVVDYSGTYTVTAVGDRVLTVAAPAWTIDVPWGAATVLVTGATDWTDWVTLPSTDRTEVWCNITAPNGMYLDNGGKSTATTAFDIQIEKLDAVTMLPLGVVETVTGSLSGVDTDQQADTIEHATAWTGPARVRMRRTTLYDYTFPGTVQDEIKWADLYSVSPVSKTEFGNKTTLHTITQATARATAVKTRQLNCIASRLLPIYNGATFSGAFDASGRHVSGTISATSRLSDIIAAVSVDPQIGARDLATEVDMPQIWSVQQQLDAWNTACGQFNYTLDTDNTSFEETIVMIADAGFCIAYRQNGKIRLALDQLQPSSTALFTHRNKKPGAETITRRFSSDSDFDGVEFVYSDPDSQQSETITLPLSGAYHKLKKFEIAGIRSFPQAWLRANREYQKILGQRITLETTTTLDARSLLPNARIDVVDNTRFKSYDGEVVGQSGLELTLSRDVAFTPGLPHSLVLMRRDGSLQSIPVTAGSAPNKIILQSLPSEAISTMYGADGIRTIFSFAADSARGAMAYQVQEIDISDGQYCVIHAVNYSDSYYDSDYLTIPSRMSVIN